MAPKMDHDRAKRRLLKALKDGNHDSHLSGSPEPPIHTGEIPSKVTSSPPPHTDENPMKVTFTSRQPASKQHPIQPASQAAKQPASQPPSSQPASSGLRRHQICKPADLVNLVSTRVRGVNWYLYTQRHLFISLYLSLSIYIYIYIVIL